MEKEERNRILKGWGALAKKGGGKRKRGDYPTLARCREKNKKKDFLSILTTQSPNGVGRTCGLEEKKGGRMLMPLIFLRQGEKKTPPPPKEEEIFAARK